MRVEAKRMIKRRSLRYIEVWDMRCQKLEQSTNGRDRGEDRFQWQLRGKVDGECDWLDVGGGL
jgi:hypothetical protein